MTPRKLKPSSEMLADMRATNPRPAPRSVTVRVNDSEVLARVRLVRCWWAPVSGYYVRLADLNDALGTPGRVDVPGYAEALYLATPMPAGTNVEELRVLCEREVRVKDDTILDLRNRAHAIQQRCDRAERVVGKWNALLALMVDDTPAALRMLAEHVAQEQRSREPEIDSRPDWDSES